MSIKIKFSFDELRRRAAKMLDVHPSYIDNFREVQMAYDTAINLLPELRRANNQH
jgi:hypothetical protein